MAYYIKDNAITTLPEYVECVEYFDATEDDDVSVIEKIVRKRAIDCTSDELASAGYHYVSDYEYDPDFEKLIFQNGEWVIVPSDASIERDNAWTSILKLRQELLDSTDYIVNEYSTMSEEDVQAWKDYRQSLRDITQHRTGKIDDWMTAVIPDSPDTAAYKENINEG
jgi:hypothetical protein